jgi:glutamyl-tRNA synthetase
MLTPAEFIDAARPFLTGDVSWPADRFDQSVFDSAAPLIQTRIGALADIPAMVDFFFLADPAIDPDAWSKTMASEYAADVLDAMSEGLRGCEWGAEGIKAVLDAFTESRGLKLGKTQAPVRVAVTGRTVGPPLFESIEILGREETLRRIAAARSRLT